MISSKAQAVPLDDLATAAGFRVEHRGDLHSCAGPFAAVSRMLDKLECANRTKAGLLAHDAGIVGRQA